jgi:hypothetical protein
LVLAKLAYPVCHMVASRVQPDVGRMFGKIPTSSLFAPILLIRLMSSSIMGVAWVSSSVEQNNTPNYAVFSPVPRNIREAFGVNLKIDIIRMVEEGWPWRHRNHIILRVDGWGLRRDDDTIGDGVNLLLAVWAKVVPFEKIHRNLVQCYDDKLDQTSMKGFGAQGSILVCLDYFRAKEEGMEIILLKIDTGRVFDLGTESCVRLDRVVVTEDTGMALVPSNVSDGQPVDYLCKRVYGQFRAKRA